MTNHSFSININAFGLCCLLDLFIDFYIKKIFTFSIFLSKQQLCLFKKKKKIFRLKKLYIWIHTFGHWSSEKTHYCCTMFKWLFKTFQEYIIVFNWIVSHSLETASENWTKNAETFHDFLSISSCSPSLSLALFQTPLSPSIFLANFFILGAKCLAR